MSTLFVKDDDQYKTDRNEIIFNHGGNIEYIYTDLRNASTLTFTVLASNGTLESVESEECIVMLEGINKSIRKIAKTKSDGLKDTYTIYYTDGSKSSFTVNNGSNGAKPFNLLIEQELFSYKTNGNNKSITSYDRIKSNNDKYPLTLQSADDGGKINEYSVSNNLSFVKSVAFDPDKTGKKDHVAIIGVRSAGIDAAEIIVDVNR